MNFTFSFCFQFVNSDAKRLGRWGKDRNTSKFIAMVILAHAGWSMSNVKQNFNQNLKQKICTLQWKLMNLYSYLNQNKKSNK